MYIIIVIVYVSKKIYHLQGIASRQDIRYSPHNSFNHPANPIRYPLTANPSTAVVTRAKGKVPPHAQCNKLSIFS